MTKTSSLDKEEVLETLRLLGERIDVPLWLVGGLGADFHVGTWTRPHGDIDLVTFEEYRSLLATQLDAIGFSMTGDRGWIANWTRFGRDVGEVSIAFEERVDETTGQLVIRDEYADQGIVPGIYPLVPGDLDTGRFRELEGVRFRVTPAQAEWLYTKGFQTFRPRAPLRPSVEHNLALLESVLSEPELSALRPLIGRRLPLG